MGILHTATLFIQGSLLQRTTGHSHCYFSVVLGTFLRRFCRLRNVASGPTDRRSLAWLSNIQGPAAALSYELYWALSLRCMSATISGSATFRRSSCLTSHQCRISTVRSHPQELLGILQTSVTSRHGLFHAGRLYDAGHLAV